MTVKGYGKGLTVQRIGIIGAGDLGAVLAKRLVDLGHRVKVANSRGPHTLGEFARRTGAQAVLASDACIDVDILITAAPFGRIRDLAPLLSASLSPNTLVIDAANYIPQRDGAIQAIDDGLAETAWVSRLLGRPVFKTFNSITAFSLEHRGKPKGDRSRIALPIAGDQGAGRTAVSALVEQLGFDAYDAGPLADSWRQQPGQPAYASDPTLKELPPLLQKADRAKGPVNRDEGMKLMAKLPGFSQPELVRILRVSAGLDKFNLRSLAAFLVLGWSLLRAKPAAS